MKICLRWVYNDNTTIIKNTYALYVNVPPKVNLKWKIALTKQIEPYCRKDRKCIASFGGQNYQLSSRSPKNLVTNIAKIIIDNKPNKLNIDNITQNYVKY